MTRRLTERAVERLKPVAGRRLEISDAHVPGLQLRVGERGSKSWSVLVRVGGKQRRVTLGPYPGVDLAAARKRARAALEQADRGVDPGGARARRRDTFAVVAEQYLERCRRDRLRTADDIQRTLRPALAAWGGMPIASVRKHDALGLIDATAARAPVMANRTQSLLRRLFGWALERDIIERNPLAGLRPPAKERSRDRVLGGDELAAIWRACDELGPPWSPIIKLLLLTAGRFGEVAGATWDEVDLEARLWRLPARRAKQGREHLRPLSAPAAGLIAGLPRVASAGDWLFPGRTGAGHVVQPAAAKVRLDRLSGVTGWRIHDLRRSAATTLAELGTRPDIIAEILGHSPAALAGVTARYQRHRFLDEQRRALERWSSHLLALAAGEGAKVVALHAPR